MNAATPTRIHKEGIARGSIARCRTASSGAESIRKELRGGSAAVGMVVPEVAGI